MTKKENITRISFIEILFCLKSKNKYVKFISDDDFIIKSLLINVSIF